MLNAGGHITIVNRKLGYFSSMLELHFIRNKIKVGARLQFREVKS